MKIWFEALTGKQALLFHHLAKYFEQNGHQTYITTRDSDYTESNLQRFGRSYYSVGRYGGASLKGKLIAGVDRIKKLADLIDRKDPDLLISFPSPDATRTAFGMGIPIIILNDTPHAVAVAKLTTSLANYLVYPQILGEDAFTKYGSTNFIRYDGIDEILWIKDFSPDIKLLERFGLEKHNYFVFRCEESKAAYFQRIYPNFDPGHTILEDIIQKLSNKGYDLPVVAFPRYPEQKEILEDLGVIIPDQSVDTLSLLHYGKVSMTGGGTMGREAALLGTPTIYTFPLELKVSTFVSNRGFPLFHEPNHLNAPRKIIKHLKMKRMEENKRRQLIRGIESPISGIEQAISQMKKDGKL